MPTQIGLALLLSGIVTALALWRGSLSRSGAVGALIVGSLTFGLGGWEWGVLLVVFFASASILSHYQEEQKREVAEKFDKGHRRDIGQVFANGGAGALVALLSALYPADIWWPVFVGIMGTVTADTWATELGTLSRRRPRLITNGKIVPVGTSGGITPYGTAVSFAGGLLIGLVAALMTQQWLLLLLGGIGGLIGSLYDSLLGATVQQIYICDVCQKETEKKRHHQQPTRPLKGWSWMNNDVVNLLASMVGGGVTGIIFIGLSMFNISI